MRRLIITQPPRSLKSICASVAFVAWALGRNPKLRFICVSYSDALAAALARQFRQVVNSGWYRALFPGTRLSKDTGISTLPSAETVLRWYPRGNRILAQPDRDVAAAPEATLVLPPVPDSVLRLVLAVDSARLPCGHDVAPLISMMDRNPPPMLACPLTPIHAPMPVKCSNLDLVISV